MHCRSQPEELACFKTASNLRRDNLQQVMTLAAWTRKGCTAIVDVVAGHMFTLKTSAVANKSQPNKRVDQVKLRVRLAVQEQVQQHNLLR
jgi:putative protein kinase ArgK-like GTPase of G3E family